GHKQQAITRFVKGKVAGSMTGSVNRFQTPASGAVRARAQVQMIAIANSSRNSDPILEFFRGPGMGPDRDLVSLGTCVGCSDMMGMMVREHNGRQPSAGPGMLVQQIK